MQVRTDDITIICLYLEGLTDDEQTNGNSALNGHTTYDHSALDLTSIALEVRIRTVFIACTHDTHSAFTLISSGEAQVCFIVWDEPCSHEGLSCMPHMSSMV